MLDNKGNKCSEVNISIVTYLYQSNRHSQVRSIVERGAEEKKRKVDGSGTVWAQWVMS